MVVISNGFSKFHLSVAAAEADRRRLLTSFLTGAYPTPLIRKILALPLVRTNAKARRLSARDEEIASGRVHALFSPELLHTLGMLCHSESLNVASFRLYGRSAIRYVEQAAAGGARIYHFRSGFGGESVEVARRLGMFLLCDHASPHPYVEEFLVENMGRMPQGQNAARVSSFYGPALSDMERADAILVNSRFAGDTFSYSGYNRNPIHVIYWGVDDAFLTQVPERENASDQFRLLFAGHFEKRKGAELVVEACGRLDNIPWRLEVAGPVGADLAELSRSFFADPHVKYLGLLSRRDLASAMARADVFVFPSLSEGSARVVFEALACGCYVITTPNSGSIVEDGVHGAVVSPGDSASLARAIEHAYQHRDKVSEIGKNNAQCVRTRYRQCDYGNQLSNLYGALLRESRVSGISG
jgi:glycosyltransferase involved in cell wall biosynthesis